KTKPKSEFPTEESLDNFLGVQAIGYNDRNANRTHKGFGQVTDTSDFFHQSAPFSISAIKLIVVSVQLL
ncbi:hypothetical protein BTI56_02690, partial [Lactobacillus delbrueckii subsp. bulgaricus]|nr:hypothetical protein [Lactobacillus delbrueckii subsp. bulgaricus]